MVTCWTGLSDSTSASYRGAETVKWRIRGAPEGHKRAADTARFRDRGRLETAGSPSTRDRAPANRVDTANAPHAIASLDLRPSGRFRIIIDKQHEPHRQAARHRADCLKRQKSGDRTTGG